MCVCEHHRGELGGDKTPQGDGSNAAGSAQCAGARPVRLSVCVHSGTRGRAVSASLTPRTASLLRTALPGPPGQLGFWQQGHPGLSSQPPGGRRDGARLEFGTIHWFSWVPLPEASLDGEGFLER